MKLSRNRSTRIGLLTFGLGMGVAGYILVHTSKTDKPKKFAPVAAPRLCGVSPKDSQSENSILKDWLIDQDDISASGKATFARVASAIPEGVAKSFRAKGIKIGFATGREPFSCAGQGGYQQYGNQASCVKQITGLGEVLLIASLSDINPDGMPSSSSPQDTVERGLLPVIFWTTINHLWDVPRNTAIIPDNAPNEANLFAAATSQVSKSLKFSSEEKEFYRKEFGGSGTSSPRFMNRAVVLLSSALYCDKASFDRLNESQPEAVKAYMTTFACALGKPWHLDEKSYLTFCPVNIASASESKP